MVVTFSCGPKSLFLVTYNFFPHYLFVSFMASNILTSHHLFVKFFFEVQDLFLPIGFTFVGVEHFGQLLFFVPRD